MKKELSKKERLQKAQLQHQLFLKKVGYIPRDVKSKTTLKETYTLKVDQPAGLPGVSNNIQGVCFKKSIDDYKWKQGREETPETINKIEEKKNRVAIAFNKGSYQYITDESDPKNFGKK